MGSRLSETYAYIAGFLDGDGSLMLQIKKRTDSTRGIRFMVTICFYQDSRHEKELQWIRDVLKVGYLSRRNDGMSELRINGYAQVHSILLKLLPFVRFKKVQATALLKASEFLMNGSIKKLTQKQLLLLVDLIFKIQNANYVTRKKPSKEELRALLGLTP